MPLVLCGFDLSLGLSLASLVAVGVYGVVDRGAFVRALLVVLTGFNGLSPAHWVIFVSLGLNSPLGGVR